MSIVKVNQEKCIGCGACVAIDPENFDFDDYGISTVINEIAGEKAKEAEEACPVYAIDIIEETKESKEKENKHECDCTECQDTTKCSGNICECEDSHCTDCDNDDCECEECHCTDCECQDHFDDENED